MSHQPVAAVNVIVNGYAWRGQFTMDILADFICKIKDIIIQDYDPDDEDKAQLYQWLCDMELEGLWDMTLYGGASK